MMQPLKENLGKSALAVCIFLIISAASAEDRIFSNEDLKSYQESESSIAHQYDDSSGESGDEQEGTLVPRDFYLCTHVIDGDTIIMDIEGTEEIVRLIGVDTPETVHGDAAAEWYGPEAWEFTRSRVEGKMIRLEYDIPKRDSYGRLLAYVYLEDGTFLNAEIVRRGYGHASTRYHFTYIQDFREYERDARIHERGLWRKEGRFSTEEKGAPSEGEKTLDLGTILERDDEGQFKIGLHCYHDDTVAYCRAEHPCFGFRKDDVVHYERYKSESYGIRITTRLVTRSGRTCPVQCILKKEYIEKALPCNFRELIERNSMR